jgi:hypothetical protein
VLRQIFDRMNSYGKRLSRAEIFSALNAGDESDAEHTLTIDQIADHVEDGFGFGRIDADTVLRAILARRGPDVHREIRFEFDDDNRRGDLEFRNEDRDSAFAAGEEALVRAVRFLQSIGVPHVALLGYRYLLVVLTRVFAAAPGEGFVSARQQRRNRLTPRGPAPRVAGRRRWTCRWAGRSRPAGRAA